MLELLFKGEGLKFFDISDFTEIMDTTGWVFNPARGWYRDAYTWEVGVPLNLPNNILGRLRGIEGDFTGYYNQPSGCMATNYLTVSRDNGNVHLGTFDSWNYDPSGQIVYRGDLEDEIMVTRNVLNERFGLTIPRGVSVSKITAVSGGWSENGINYPFSLRGMKNLRFWYG